MKRLEMPDSVPGIGENCFGYCGSLDEVVFGPSSRLTSLGKSAFSYSSLKRITIPRLVMTLEAHCFCASLECLSFSPGSALERIEECVVQSCSSLKRFEVLKGVRFLHGSSFQGVSMMRSRLKPDHRIIVVQPKV